MNYQQNQRLAQSLAQYQPVQGGGLAGALAQGLAGFGSGYFGGQAINQQQQMSKTLADSLAKGDSAGFLKTAIESGDPALQGLAYKTQMEQMQKENERKQMMQILGIQENAAAVGSTPGAGAGGKPSPEDWAKLAVVDPRYAPMASFSQSQEKQGKEDLKFPDTQRASAGYTNRMSKAETIMKGLEGQGYSPAADVGSVVANKVPGVGNYYTSPEFQSYKQAQEDWVRAKLRKESGAVIGPQEMADEIKTYFPQPGDKPETVAQKAVARFQAFKQLQAESGDAYKTLFKDDLASNPYLVDSRPLGTPNPQPQAGQQPAGQPQTGQADPNIAGALQAIQAGAPSDAVKSRLLQSGYTQEQLKAAGL